jgi:hypothetical protein
LPDHEHLYHAERTEERVQSLIRRGWSDPFAPASFPVGEWGEIVERSVAAIAARGGLSTLIVHPLCMHTADRFSCFGDLLKFLSRYPTVWAHEASSMV